MKNRNRQNSSESYAELHAQLAIGLITKWVEQRYPKISAPTKSRLIIQCLMEVAQERKAQINLN